MGHKFAEIAFTQSVQQVQRELGSRDGYTAMETGDDFNHLLSQREADFIMARDSFYMASVSETGWPYVQHRGGPTGFMRVLDEKTIGFADFSGNRQYVSVGNFRKDDRVSLFFMDYPNRTRFKLLGRVELVGPEQTELLAKLEVADYRAQVERGFLIHIEAFDWNCPQHITPRYTDSHIEALMAPLLEENRLLKAHSKSVGNTSSQVLGSGPLELVISGVRQLTPRVRAFELRDPKGADLPAVEAGSHLQFTLQLTDGREKICHYSISSNPARRDAYEIAVLREDEGKGGSIAVHEQFDIGRILHCELPQNHFQLHNDARPTLLIAGGIGITPIKAMAQALKARGADMHLYYVGRSGAEMAFRDRLVREFNSEISIYRSSEDERLNIKRVLDDAPDDAIVYVCGPGRLIDAVVDTAAELQIDPGRIRFERFDAVISADAKPIQVELRRSGKQLEVAANQTILDAMLEAGVSSAYSCRAGNCKSCAVKVLAGDPEHRDSALSMAERTDYGLMCPCVSRAKSDHLVLDI
ncbi:MAG: 2Fe-2S iron-sulfur cluster-binding protein [Gammaproteobacteria bacterium]|nr:2Fe-2S iron-sulfur cluster-binding protein [Gammaproteobacteria bacterium]